MMVFFWYVVSSLSSIITVVVGVKVVVFMYMGDLEGENSSDLMVDDCLVNG